VVHVYISHSGWVYYSILWCSSCQSALDMSHYPPTTTNVSGKAPPNDLQREQENEKDGESHSESESDRYKEEIVHRTLPSDILNKNLSSVPKTNDDTLFVFSGANKAGMSAIDKERQANVIYEASKNSAFFQRTIQLNAKTMEKVKSMNAMIQAITPLQAKALEAKVKHRCVELEAKRDFSRICCVLDMDMFFAAVEIRDQPHLRDKPVAVGGMSMISTTNYIARQYGVRSAMPGFIGKKLCPELIFVRSNFAKYQIVADQIRGIVSEYDPKFRSYSLDEVYMDLTNVSRRRLTRKSVDPTLSGSASHPASASSSVPSEVDHPIPYAGLREEAMLVLKEIRQKITLVTGGLTCSAGIGNNFLLAKICADVNKPDGQFQVPADRQAVIEFMEQLPVRRVGGIGKVSENMLSSMGMKTMGDVKHNLVNIMHAFSPKFTDFLLKSCLGMTTAECEGSQADEDDSDGGHNSDDDEDDDGPIRRKSVSVERTFSSIATMAELRNKLTEIVGILSRHVSSKNLQGQQVTLKMKTTDFEIISRSHLTSQPVSASENIESVAYTLLEAIGPASIRLMGVKLSKLSRKVEKKAAAGPLLKYFSCANHKSATINKIDNGLLRDEMHNEGSTLLENVISDGGVEYVGEFDEHLPTIFEDIGPGNSKSPQKRSRGAVTSEAVSPSVALSVSSHHSSLAPSQNKLSGDSPNLCPMCGDVLRGSLLLINDHIDRCLLRCGDSVEKRTKTVHPSKAGRKSSSGSRTVVSGSEPPSVLRYLEAKKT
jgi:DNA polymerase kappa